MGESEHPWRPSQANAGWRAPIRSLFTPPRLTVEELEAYGRESRRRIIERFRLGVPIGVVGMIAIFFLWSQRMKDPRAQHLVIEACFVAIGALVLYLPLCGLRPFRERPNWLILPVSLAVTGAGAVASVASSAIDRELDLVAAASLLVIWIYGSVLAPLPPRDFLLDILAQYAVVTGGLWLGSPTGTLNPMYVALTSAGGGLALLGVVIRENADRRSFAAHRRLDDAHRLVAEQRAELEQMNARLEGRVEAQVKEISSHVREVDALNVQLQQRVQERSRELAAALEKLGQTEESWNARKLEPGSVVGERAKVVRLLGEGGMGEVYLCEDLLTGQRVALKVIRGGGAVDERALQRVLGEAAAAASITHPGVVKTLHVDVSADGSLYLLTEYVSGETLSSRIGRGALAAGEAARLGHVLAGALAAAHARGVVHRDVKPHNVMLTSTAPGVKLLDFGISKTADPMWSSTVTATGQILGSPAYMAPEQFRNSSDVTSACDVYSLGLVVFEAAAGKGPFAFDDLLQAMAAHTLEAPPHLSDEVPAVPKAMSDLVASCLAKSPKERPAAARVAELLGRIADELGAPDATEFAPPVSLVSPTAASMRSRAGGA